MTVGPLVLANPFALWALIAIPALLLIHLLQQKAKRMEVSTLFLLQRIAPEASEGRRIDRLRSSIPLWLQLLAILLVTWVLADPHWIEARSVQRAVLILDSSASMSVFRERMIAAVERTMGEIEEGAARTEWVVIDSDVAKKTLYSGTDRAAALAQIEAFDPKGSAHDFGPAIAVGQGLARGRGPIVLVTDHEVAVSGASVLAVGQPVENVGFTGLTVKRTAEGVEWSAMVRNHGRTAAKRTLSIEGAEPTELELEPGEVRTLHGAFPKDQDRARLVLMADAFPLDDTAPMVRPRAKTLRVYAEPEMQQLEVVQRLVAGLDAAALLTDARGADLVIAGRKSSDAIDLAASAIVLLIDDAPEKTNDLEPILAERVPLNEGLAWQGLLRRKTSHLSIEPTDAPILWQGDRPLIALRDDRLLIVDFDPRHSNAERMPSFAVLLLRFVETIRARKAELEARNVETRQALELAIGPDEEVVLRTEHDEQHFDPKAGLFAPAEPGFFFVQQGKLMLLAGGARFGDLRESDLSQAASADPRIDAGSLALLHARPDPLRPLQLILAGTALLGAWFFAQRRRAL